MLLAVFQGPQNVMYEPRDDVAGVSFVHDEEKE